MGQVELQLSQVLHKKFDQSKVGVTNGIKDRVSNCWLVLTLQNQAREPIKLCFCHPHNHLQTNYYLCNYVSPR